MTRIRLYTVGHVSDLYEHAWDYISFRPKWTQQARDRLPSNVPVNRGESDNLWWSSCGMKTENGTWRFIQLCYMNGRRLVYDAFLIKLVRWTAITLTFPQKWCWKLINPITGMFPFVVYAIWLSVEIYLAFKSKVQDRSIPMFLQVDITDF